MSSLVSANVWFALLFVAVAIATLTITAGAIFAWRQRQDEEELPPLQNLQEGLAKMMQERQAQPNKSAWV